jgi:hypothetical protein
MTGTPGGETVKLAVGGADAPWTTTLPVMNWPCTRQK